MRSYASPDTDPDTDPDNVHEMYNVARVEGEGSSRIDGGQGRPTPYPSFPHPLPTLTHPYPPLLTLTTPYPPLTHFLLTPHPPLTARGGGRCRYRA